MPLDKELTLSAGQQLTASGNSTNIVDESVARNLGSGEPLYFVVHLSAKAGTTPTFQAKLVGADDAAFSSNKITIVDTGTLSDPAVPALKQYALPTHTAKRYYRVEYVLGGTSPDFTFTAGIANGQTTIPMV